MGIDLARFNTTRVESTLIFPLILRFIPPVVGFSLSTCHASSGDVDRDILQPHIQRLVLDGSYRRRWTGTGWKGRLESRDDGVPRLKRDWFKYN